MRKKHEYTHYEKIRIISARALQISQGAPVLVPLPEGMISPLVITKMEWDREVIPIDTVRRVS